MSTYSVENLIFLILDSPDLAVRFREFLRDHEMARETRGLLFTTAGSINNGSRLTGMRLIMSAIQHFGRFDG